MPFNIPLVIEQTENEFPLTFEFLRKHGIEYLQVFSGNIWTDFNLHDPGITILEQLCFALSDLSYRTEFSIEHILAEKNGEISRENNIFVLPREALTTSPINLNDFKRYLIDRVQQVSNVWFERIVSLYTSKYIRGLYRVIVQITAEETETRAGNKHLHGTVQDITTLVKTTLAAVRTIGHDFAEIVVLEKLKITVKAEMIIDDSVAPAVILANVFIQIKAFLDQSVEYSTEKELLDKGYRMEDVYDGPLLHNGIILESELTPRYTEIDPLQLANFILLNVKGLLSVKTFHIFAEGSTEDKHNQQLDVQNKPLRLPLNHYPFVTENLTDNDIKFYINQLPVNVDAVKFRHTFNKIQEQTKMAFITAMHRESQKTTLTGRYREIEKYYSVQNYFPDIYRLGKEGMAEAHAPEDKAKVLQLKAYLMLFEQVLANYLAQLANISNLFSPAVADDKAKQVTYFFQPLYNVPGSMDIIKSFTNLYRDRVYGKKEWDDFINEKDNGYLTHITSVIETDKDYQQRKNIFFDHLLARFNIAVSGFAVSLFDLYYNRNTKTERVDSLLKWKACILKNVNAIISQRVTGTNYLNPTDNDVQNSFEKNINLFLHIEGKQGRKLTHVANAPKAKVALHHEATEIAPAKLVIKHQPISFLHVGLDVQNYEVVETGTVHEIVFKHPENDEKNVIGNFKDREEAKNALDSAIKAIRQMNIDSEGFHFIEHLLLRPGLQSKAFGLRLYGAGNAELFHSKIWFDFNERENFIRDLLNAVKDIKLAIIDLNNGSAVKPNGVHPGKKKQNLANKITHFKNVLTQAGELNMYGTEYERLHAEKLDGFENKQLENIYINLNFYLKNKDDSPCFFKYVVRLNEKESIDEDFYNFRVSFVFSSWPARFQDLNFRDFAQTLIQTYTPAHLHTSVYWLGLKEMEHFEAVFFTWYSSLKSNHVKADNIATYTQTLTLLLAKHNKCRIYLT